MTLEPLFVLTPALLGVAHAFDADHVVAVSALAAGTTDPGRAVRLVLVWGIGHTIPLLAVAALGVALGVVMPPAIAGVAERSVGVMLLLLGGMVLYSLRSRRIHIHAHAHDGVPHVHFHAHHDHPGDHRHTHAAVLTGVIHGLAGSATPMVLLPLGAVRSAWEVLLFVAVFGLAVAATMAGYAFCLGRLAAALGDRSHLPALALRSAIGLTCIVAGGVWITA
jgi:hypothetical protein